MTNLIELDVVGMTCAHCARAVPPRHPVRARRRRPGRELLLRAEVRSSLDVLRSATLVNADLLGRSGELGVVSPGAYGDLLLVSGNPLEDLGS